MTSFLLEAARQIEIGAHGGGQAVRELERDDSTRRDPNGYPSAPGQARLCEDAAGEIYAAN